MQQADSHQAIRYHQQRKALGQAARMLGAATDFNQSLKHTLAACLPEVADFGFFDAVLPDGSVRRTAAAHRSPRIEAILAPTQWVKQVHPRLNLCALSTGEPALHPSIDDGWYREIAANDQHLAVLRDLGFRSMISVPMRYREELIGALTLFMAESGRRHDEADLELATELAMLAAPVVVNARLLEQYRSTADALLETNERLNMAVEAGRVGIWDWRIPENRVSWSARVYEMHQMTPGVDPGGVDRFRERVHPQDRDRVHAAMQAALEGGPSYDVEFRALLPDGSARWISTRGKLVRAPDGKPLRMVGASIDTTERVELLAAERAARGEAEAAGRRLQLLASASALLAGSLDPEDTLAAFASTIVPDIADWCRIDLMDANGVLQRRVAHHRDPEQARRALEMARRMRAAPGTVGSLGWCVANARAHHGRYDEPPAALDPVLREYTQTFGMREHFIVPLVARGRTIGVMAVIQAESGRGLDTPDRALVQELAHRAALAIDNANAYAEAGAARRQAEAASRAKDEFMAMLGHELRNPLAPIITTLELMERREPAALLAERRIIGRQVKHLSRLIDDLLDVSRFTTGKVELQCELLDLRTVIAQAAEQTQPLFERRLRPLRLSLPEQAAWVDGDATRLVQVVCNLLVNAAKFTPADGEVALLVSMSGAWVEVTVEDSGRGMPAELLPRVFELFVQGRQTVERSSGGLGLGLTIVRMLVELHGGQVAAHSEGEGCGSRFVVRLPLRPEPVLHQEPAAPAAEPQQAGVGARILIVDDNADAADTLADLLRAMGYEVRCAGDADAAVALLDRYVPQLALLDIGLPGQDGHALARRLRADRRTMPARLVALTGYGSDADRARALGGAFDEYLVKPVQLERLESLLQQMLRVHG